jgi:hypothetical protein
MAEQRSPLPFEPKGSGKVAKEPAGAKQEAIPRYVADRMARRVAVFTGLPSLAGMGVFVASYFVVTRDIAEIPPGATLVGSGFFFVLGLVGLSVGGSNGQLGQGTWNSSGIREFQAKRSTHA